MSFKGWTILFVSSLIIITTVILSLFFYSEFQKTLDERVLLQLTSIKRLKRIQIENYLTEKWTSFEEEVQSINKHNPATYHIAQLNSPHNKSYIDSIISIDTPKGIHDISQFSKNGKLLLLFVMPIGENQFLLKYDSVPKIQTILLERTGMGHTGETYIVGSDHHLRSESRFSPKTPPYRIHANTLGVISALNNQEGNNIIKDYRNEMVYSAYHPIKQSHFQWAILSEIDVKEVTSPLTQMKKKLIYVCGSVLFIVIFISFILINKISKPIQQAGIILNKMAEGNYDLLISPVGYGVEVKQLYKSLIDLQLSLTSAVNFANEIGKMNLEMEYKTAKSNDLLSTSLITMRDKLKDFQRITDKNQQASKQLLIKGQENERKRLSKDLHDGIGPLLTTLKLVVNSIEFDPSKKTELKNLIDTTIIEVRRMTDNLMPQSLIDFGVSRAIANWIELVNKTSEIEIKYVNFTSEVNNNRVLEIEICLFRVVQELLNNAIKHSNAEKVKLSLTEFDNKICLYYADNGIGFDLENNNSGSGINNIKERINILEGYLSIHSNNGNTEIEVELPLKKTT